MRTFIFHFKDNSTSKLSGSTPEEVLAQLDRSTVSWYEEPQAERETQHKLEEQKKEEEQGSNIVPRTLKVPSATSDKTYDVVVFPNGEVYCPCIGFANRHYCWHSTYVKELLKEEKKNGTK